LHKRFAFVAGNDDVKTISWVNLQLRPEMDMKNSLGLMLAATVFIAATPMSSAAYAQRTKSGVQQPTTKAGKCAKANGGVYDAQRNGWYTLDQLNYRKCMSSP
jgi:hypothetical protein